MLDLNEQTPNGRGFSIQWEQFLDDKGQTMTEFGGYNNL